MNKKRHCLYYDDEKPALPINKIHLTRIWEHMRVLAKNRGMEDPGELFIVTENSSYKAEQLITDPSKNWDLIVLDLMEEDPETHELLNRGANLAQVTRRFLEVHPKRRLGVIALSHSEEELRAIGVFRREFEREARADLSGFYKTFGVSYLHKDEARREDRSDDLGKMLMETLVDAGVLTATARIDTLRFDLKNPRLCGYDGLDELTQEAAFNLYWNEFDAHEIANSIYQEGFWSFEPLVGYDNNDGTQTIVEGNRRLAAIRGLLDDNFRRLRLNIADLNLEKLEALKTLPAVIFSKKDEIPEAYIAFKHHNAPFRWRGYARAAYINSLVEGNQEAMIRPLSLEQAAIRCGDSENVTPMYYRVYRILEQARTVLFKGRKGEVIYDPKWRFNYPYSLNFESLALGLERIGIQEYLGVLDIPKEDKKPVKTKFYPRLRKLLMWVLGDNRNNSPPRILEGTNDWGLLEALVYNDDAIDRLDAGESLETVAQLIEPREDGDTSLMSQNARIHLDLVTAERILNGVFEQVKMGAPLNPVQWDMLRNVKRMAQMIGNYEPRADGKEKLTPWRTPD